MKEIPNGYAWTPSPELVSFSTDFHANVENAKSVLSHCCGDADKWRNGPNKFTLPLNLFGLRVHKSFSKNTESDPRCPCARGSVTPPNARCYCGVTGKTNMEQIMYATKALLSARHSGWTFVQPPSNVPVIRPGQGVLIHIPADAGRVAFVFTGACFLCKYKKNSKKCEEFRLPKTEQKEAYVALEGFEEDYTAYGQKAPEASPILTGFIVPCEATIILFVPSPESHPWAEGDTYPCYSSLPGYLFTILSSQNKHRVVPIEARNAFRALASPEIFLAGDCEDDEDNPRGSKRLRDEEDEKGDHIEDDDEEDPILPDYEIGHPAFPDDDEAWSPSPEHFFHLPALTPVDDALRRLMGPRLSPLPLASSAESLSVRMGPHDGIDTTTSFIRNRHVSNTIILPKFELRRAYTHEETGEVAYEVASPNGQAVETRISRGEKGLIVSTTTVYFCKVRWSIMAGFFLETVSLSSPALLNLDNNYFSHHHLDSEPPVNLTQTILTKLSS